VPPRYRLTLKAEDDLSEIKAYLVRQGGSRLARHVLGELRAAFRFLGGTPGAGHSREDLTDAPVKFWTVFSYLIAYDPAKRPIEIVRVMHGARDVPSLLGDDG
jgi:plasmid stabilization system protein ParE